jgi:hypothetical protein
MHWQGSGMAEREGLDFDRLLAEHADVRAAYRAEASSDQPPADLDAAILAASRRAVGARSVGTVGRLWLSSRWAMPLSAAAVVVLASSLSFLVYDEQGDPSLTEAGRPAPAASVPAAPVADLARKDSAADVGPRVDDREAGLALSGSRSTAEGVPRDPRNLPGVPKALPPEAASQSAPVGQSARADAAPAPLIESASPALPEVANPRLAPGDDTPEASAEASRESGLRSAVTLSASPPAAPSAQSAAGAPAPDAAPMAGRPAGPESRREADASSAAELVARERAAVSAQMSAARAVAAPARPEEPAAWIARIRALLETGRIDPARIEVARLRCRHPDVTLPADFPAPAPDVPCAAVPAKEGFPGHR